MPLLEILSMELFDDKVDIRDKTTPAGRMWKATLDSITMSDPIFIAWGIDTARPAMVLLMIVWQNFQKFESFHLRGIDDNLMRCYHRQRSRMRYVSDFEDIDSIQHGRTVAVGILDPEQATGCDLKELLQCEGNALEILALGMQDCQGRCPSKSTLTEHAVLVASAKGDQNIHEGMFTPELQVVLQTHERGLPAFPKMPNLNRVSDVFAIHPLSFDSQSKDNRVQFRGGPAINTWIPINEKIPPRIDLVSRQAKIRLTGVSTFAEVLVKFSEAAFIDDSLKPEAEAAWRAYRTAVWNKRSTKALKRSCVTTYPEQPHWKGLILEWQKDIDGRQRSSPDLEAALAKLDSHIEFRKVEHDVRDDMVLPFTSSPKLLEVLDFVFLKPPTEADQRAFEFLQLDFAHTAGSGRMVPSSISYFDDPPSTSSDSDSDSEEPPFDAVWCFQTRWLEHDKGSAGAVFRLILQYDSEDARRLWVRNYSQQSYVLMGHRAHALGQMPDYIMSTDMVMILEDFGSKQI